MSREAAIEAFFGTLSDSFKNEITPQPVTTPQPPDKPSGQRPARLPRPGTRIQRSDADHRRKEIMLMSPPLPRPRRRGGPASAPPPRRPMTRPAPPAPSTNRDAPRVCAATTSQAVTPTTATAAVISGGPGSSPPVLMTLDDGHTVTVPYQCATRWRKYQATTPSGRWLIRFDRNGRPRMIRRLEEKGEGLCNGAPSARYEMPLGPTSRPKTRLGAYGAHPQTSTSVPRPLWWGPTAEYKRRSGEHFDTSPVPDSCPYPAPDSTNPDSE
ncbi:hypothetical protein RF55_13031 [Lasius niger]|uniref:Uncharacterized protein n=1 Tax=Lasius niger TaxID=67767 RepID=A0A0J7KBI2_LASNI|nr:hypothetical protein RF55_13031 [Lasius niger]